MNDTINSPERSFSALLTVIWLAHAAPDATGRCNVTSYRDRLFSLAAARRGAFFLCDARTRLARPAGRLLPQKKACWAQNNVRTVLQNERLINKPHSVYATAYNNILDIALDSIVSIKTTIAIEKCCSISMRIKFRLIHFRKVICEYY